MRRDPRRTPRKARRDCGDGDVDGEDGICDEQNYCCGRWILRTLMRRHSRAELSSRPERLFGADGTEYVWEKMKVNVVLAASEDGLRSSKNIKKLDNFRQQNDRKIF